MSTGNACMTCVHFDASVRDREVCDAFPDGIPAKILDGRVSHRTPVSGDNGIQWEPADGFEHMAEDAQAGA